ncbi:basic salivary proline-rich protein 1-like [Poecile atricapillus]|uniref:basic salivary proline-rich protein 1-like n=1 Tax=Poecile atricapillus TaxID=48891 RepID=UPI002739C670|nr:basic salivary proline-rich protein 1-like [Poecile atricapillus]
MFQLELGQRRNSRTRSRQILQGQGGATGRAALGVTQKPILWSQGMIFLPQSPLPHSRAVSPTMVQLHTRAARGGRCRRQGRVSSRQTHPGGKPRLGWRSGLASARPLFFPGTGRRVSRVPVRRAGRAPRSPARSRFPQGFAPLEGPAAFPGPQRGKSTVSPPSRGASLTQPRTSPLLPPFRVPRGSQGAPGQRLRIAGGIGRGPEARPPGRAAGKSEQLLPGFSRGDGGSPAGMAGPTPPPPPATCFPSPSGSEVAVATDQHHPPGQGSSGAAGTARSAPASHGDPRPAPPAAAARPPPRSDVSPDGLSCPGGARPPPSATAIGHRHRPPPSATAIGHRHRPPPSATARAPAPGPPCAVPAATSASPVQAKLHPFKLNPL